MTFLEAQEILSKIRYKRAKFYLSTGIGRDWACLTIRMPTPDIATARVTNLMSNLEFMLEGLTEKAFVESIYDACVEMETHEVGEWFEYDGERPRDPHKYDPNHKPIATCAAFPAYENELRKFDNLRSKLIEDRSYPVDVKFTPTPYGEALMDDMLSQSMPVRREGVVNVTVVDKVEVQRKPGLLSKLWSKLFK